MRYYFTNMASILLLFAVHLFALAQCQEDTAADAVNSTGNKDMYVIHAMVYQVGILTNSTDEDDENATHAGNEEALTFYHTNGSNIDLTKLPPSLLTNVTGQSFVGVAPAPDHPSPALGSSNTRIVRDISSSEDTDDPPEDVPWPFKSFTKRNAPNDLVKILNGTSIIPQEASVQSIGIPPLLSLNNNLSEIPVPIPNTSVVQYAKINTLIKPANRTHE